MSKRKWNSGKPPHVGWWNASLARDHLLWRWWNGAQWSIYCHQGHSGEAVEARARCASNHRENQTMEWTDYYPENARVPRINPNKKG